MSAGAPARIVGEHLCKIFGPAPDTALSLLEAGVDKDEVFARTGHVVGVRDASFEVRAGEIFVVMGLSGSGKSTLVRLVNRLIEATAGTVYLDGTDLTALDEASLRAIRRRDVTMVFQSFALMPHMNNLANAAFGLEIAGVERGERLRRARDALETVGLGPYADSYPHELSGGMQQRVGLARALAVEPGILLMDEAFSALDPLIRLEMQEEVRRIQRERDLTVMFISHDLDEALHIGDRLAIMQDGAIVQTGTPQELITAPASEYVEAFFANVNLAKVFTAGDLARRDPDATLRLDGEALAPPVPTDGRHPPWINVLNADGSFAGIAAGAELGAAPSARADLQSAMIPQPVTLPARATLEACIATVAETPYPVPVLRNSCFLGTLDTRRVLRALSRDTAA